MNRRFESSRPAAVIDYCPVRTHILGCWLPSVGLQMEEPRLERYEHSRLQLGTRVRIVLYAPDADRARRAAMAAFDRIDEIEAIMSRYRQDSEVNRLARDAPHGAVTLSPELYFVLDTALRFSEWSDGAFDVTVGPLVELWRQARQTGRLPDDEALRRARSLVGYRKVSLDRSRRTVQLDLDGMSIDLAALAKGYAADQALRILRQQGMSCSLVDAGGDICLGAPPPGKTAWRVAVQNQPADSRLEQILSLQNRAVATSGDAFQYVEIDGNRYSHILDPKTGYGMRTSLSATVIAPDGITADAVATALCVLPPERGLLRVKALKNVQACILRRSDRGLQRFVSEGFPP